MNWPLVKAFSATGLLVVFLAHLWIIKASALTGLGLWWWKHIIPKASLRGITNQLTSSALSLWQSRFPKFKITSTTSCNYIIWKKKFPKTCIHASFNGKYEDRRIGDFLHDSPYLSNFYFFGYFFGGGCDFCVNFLFYKIKWSLVQYNKRKYNTDRTQLTFSVGLIKYKHVYLVIEVKSYPCA